MLLITTLRRAFCCCVFVDCNHAYDVRHVMDPRERPTSSRDVRVAAWRDVNFVNSINNTSMCISTRSNINIVFVLELIVSLMLVRWIAAAAMILSSMQQRQQHLRLPQSLEVLVRRPLNCAPFARRGSKFAPLCTFDVRCDCINTNANTINNTITNSIVSNIIAYNNSPTRYGYSLRYRLLYFNGRESQVGRRRTSVAGVDCGRACVGHRSGSSSSSGSNNSNGSSGSSSSSSY